MSGDTSSADTDLPDPPPRWVLLVERISKELDLMLSDYLKLPEAQPKHLITMASYFADTLITDYIAVADRPYAFEIVIEVLTERRADAQHTAAAAGFADQASRQPGG